MIGSRSVLAVVTARGGSKGLPGKNVRPLAGRPLIGWTIAAAQASRCIDRLILSSDDAEIAEIAESLGCEAPFRRTPSLANDTAGSIDVVLDAADRVTGYDIVLLLQPTSPLRTAADIDGALAHMEATRAPACVSVTEAPAHPWLIYRQDDGRLAPFAAPPAGVSLRRQDLPAAWVLNGAIYAADLGWLRSERTFLQPGQTTAWAMPESRSVDIDTLADFRLAEALIAAG